MINSGVLYHVIGMEFGIKKILEWSEQEGFLIEDGDQFLINDPFICSMHAIDMGIVKPIFWEGKLQPGSPASSTRLRCLHPCNLLATFQVLRLLTKRAFVHKG